MRKKLNNQVEISFMRLYSAPAAYVHEAIQQRHEHELAQQRRALEDRIAQLDAALQVQLGPAHHDPGQSPGTAAWQGHGPAFSLHQRGRAPLR